MLVACSDVDGVAPALSRMWLTASQKAAQETPPCVPSSTTTEGLPLAIAQNAKGT
jgi:hypothetical protein